MQSVTCRTCGNRVLAEKNGTFHTNIQWLDSTAVCARLGADSASRTCPDLHDSVEALAAEGTLPVTGRDDPRLARH
ncbi:MAG: hypothetical protein WAX14_13720 [Rhodococcus sp. (in: high G+C Gram-positive bacteria)]|uniref:hypothetical protein n=1 Tax=Rhodococcus sp. TaxID=1831 RepID=UPI003BB79058